ncbi:Hypothetical predicted protein [Olea europaea subsp. europaea]|uniref:Uncharacterized protein n=1 Tax=Olea europaea subsp. europaea TaxID=158383 RepID=A0A8S0RJ62_OLEEU|nr:Hypothetical predicted protein [Olea europaea subsp. europaea]
MATQLVQLISPFTVSYRNYHYGFKTSNNKKVNWCRYTGGRSGGSNWDWERTVKPNQRSRFGNQFATDDDDEGEEFGFRNAAKQRIWWSEEFHEEDEEEEEEEGFGILEGSIGFNWIFKVFRAFGWMLPAIIISLLVGTGPNTIIMALALPLAQSTLSLVADTLWGRSGDTSSPKSKGKKWKYSGATSNTRVGKEKRKDPRTRRKEAWDYRSWASASNVSNKSGKRDRQNFGGWDELDKQTGVPKVSNTAPIVKANKPRMQDKVNMSRRTKGGTPLLVRLLIAVFPFLGSWTKLL